MIVLSDVIRHNIALSRCHEVQMIETLIDINTLFFCNYVYSESMVYNFTIKIAHNILILNINVPSTGKVCLYAKTLTRDFRLFVILMSLLLPSLWSYKIFASSKMMKGRVVSIHRVKLRVPTKPLIRPVCCSPCVCPFCCPAVFWFSSASLPFNYNCYTKMLCYMSFQLKK